MRTLYTRLLGLLLCCYAFLPAEAQFSDSFNSGFSTWTTTPLPPAFFPTVFEWDNDGEASSGALYWNGRPSIQSVSGGGALVFNADRYSFANLWGVAAGKAVSPSITILPYLNLRLRFHQYYRRFNSVTKVIYSNDGTNFSSIVVNNNIGNNVETSPASVIEIDLTGLLLPGTGRYIGFQFEGDGTGFPNGYFWIIDDVQLETNLVAGPVIMPVALGQTLAGAGYPLEIGSDQSARVPNQMIVRWEENLTPLQRQLIRTDFNVLTYEVCACDSLELWNINPSLFLPIEPLTPSPLGPINSTIAERIASAPSRTEIKEASYNTYSFNEMTSNSGLSLLPIVAEIPGVPANPTGNFPLVAILDTGIDYFHPALKSRLYNNSAEPIDLLLDNDGNCYVDDRYGWNFAYGNNNPRDDHSHGTHVAGIVVNALDVFAPSCDYRILPVKTHDSLGISTTFKEACAIYYAVERGAHVINASWGYYGDADPVLTDAVDYARKNCVYVVAAAGNEQVDTDLVMQHFPSSLPLSNIISVNAADSAQVRWLHSNYASTGQTVDIAAYGDGIVSTMPGGGYGTKSGTSMAAPIITAAVAHEVHHHGPVVCGSRSIAFSQIKTNILNSFIPFSSPLTGNNAVEGIFDFGTLAASVLPLELELFEVEEQQCQALLRWRLQHQPEGRLTLERSTDGIRFGEVATFDVPQRPSGSLYQYLDSAWGKGTSYYRLKLETRNGGPVYSDVRALTNSCSMQPVELYPNPARSGAELVLTGLTGNGGSVTISDARGVPVWRSTLPADGSARCQMTCPRLPAGWYQVQVLTGQQVHYLPLVSME